jgi:hypothetical protein
MDEEQFGGVQGRVDGQSLDAMKNFFLGRGYPHPKLIVASVTDNDLMSKKEIGQTLVANYKQDIRELSNTGVRLDSPFLGEEDFATQMARYHQGDQETWSREAASIPGKEQYYKPEYPKHGFNTIWLLYDPTRPGRQMLPKDRAIRLAKTVLRDSFATKLYRGHRGRQKLWEKNTPVILGVGYMLQYWVKNPAPDAVRLESVDQRVRAYLSRVLPSSRRSEVSSGAQVWYALGLRELPKQSMRYEPTPGGRIRRYTTFRPGVGITTARPDETARYVPLFTVQGRNLEDARERAERKLYRMIKGPDLKLKNLAYVWDREWSAANRKLVTRNSLQMLQQRIRAMKNQ